MRRRSFLTFISAFVPLAVIKKEQPINYVPMKLSIPWPTEAEVAAIELDRVITANRLHHRDMYYGGYGNKGKNIYLSKDYVERLRKYATAKR